MKTSLSIPLFSLPVFILYFVVSGSLTTINTTFSDYFADENFSITSTDIGKVSSIENERSSEYPASEEVDLEVTECESCQSCNAGGNYAQISISPSYITFDASIFIRGANPQCPCFADISGTVTYDYEITTNPGDEVITQGSVTQNIVNGQSPGYCGFGYSGGTLSNQFNYPHPGEPVSVDLTVTHVLGSHPSDTYVSNTSY